MTLTQALFLGALQGATELFPLSSLGLTVILPHLLGFGNVTGQAQFLPFVVALHLGTLLALLLAMAPEWIEVVQSILPGPSTPSRREGRRLILLLVIASIPAGLLGLLLQHPIARLFNSPLAAGGFLVVNGLLMLWAESLRRKGQHAPRRALGGLGIGDAVAMGLFQALALLPGISRSGATMVAGLTRKLSHEAAARFTFLMAVPIILAAALLELRHLHGGSHGLLFLALAGGATAFVVAYVSARFLLRYFGHHGRLTPFAFISLAIGIVAVGFGLGL